MNPQQDVDFTGTTVDHYAIVALIRAGGQGRVYRGRDQRLHRDVAIKVLPPEPATSAPSRRGLITEARTLSRLNHPHVAGVYDFVTEADRDFMVMEFVPGATLQDILAGGPLPPAEVVRLGSQLARGLAAAHAANIVHCDVKPANLKITSSGELKILDFGIAALAQPGPPGERATGTDTPVLGTLPYMAPEQLRGEPPDERSDIFSAGAVLYQMATGSPAFPQRSLSHLIEAIERQHPRRARDVNPLVPAPLERVIDTAMAKDAAARYGTAAALATALDALMPEGRATARQRVTPAALWAMVPSLR